jgi:hypothetical protein
MQESDNIFSVKARSSVSRPVANDRELKMFSYRSYVIATIMAGMLVFFSNSSKCSEINCKVDDGPETLYGSEVIIVATYRSTQKSKQKPQCWNASFDLIGELKAPDFLHRKSLNVEICEEPASVLPLKNSKWIIFIPAYIPSYVLYTTFQGKNGRIPLSSASLSEAIKQIRLENAKHGKGNELLDRFTAKNEALTK